MSDGELIMPARNTDSPENAKIWEEIRNLQRFQSGDSLCALAKQLKPELDKISTFMTTYMLESTEFKKDITKVSETVFGNGKTGLNTKVDRLEQTMATIKWVGIVIGGSSIGIFVTQLWNVLLVYNTVK